ncbi:MAG: sigma factor-like helix-turn-helix DNA-binding protein [Patescibacteria group bacterium]
MITFDSKQLVKKFLSELPERSRDVLIQRYGLGDSIEKHTLENIGQKYNITRERVRQIENHSIKNIINSPVFEEAGVYFVELQDLINSLGGVSAEQHLLEYLAKDPSTQNDLYFLLTIGKPFYKEKGDNEFQTRWYIDKNLETDVINALRKVHANFKEDLLIPEKDLLSLALKEIQKQKRKIEVDEERVKRYLKLSRLIDKNPFDEWGLVSSNNIKIRGIRSHAYLVVRQNGSPMHFTEVAEGIQKHFGKKVHTATCHNELIKDSRFVLVGRGLYALSEWGYSQGIVKDVIREILRKAGPMKKEAIVEQVLKERYVKENTVVVNLQNPNFFIKNSDGTYSLV